jgi:hypothetical protein
MRLLLHPHFLFAVFVTAAVASTTEATGSSAGLAVAKRYGPGFSTAHFVAYIVTF